MPVRPANEEAIAAAAQALADGDLVAFPTETVYGLGANALDAHAVARVFAAKERPRFNPLIVHVPNLAAAESYGVFDATAHKLAQAFWPGPLSLVLPLRPGCGIADLVTAGLGTIALRVPNHTVAQALLAKAKLPLAAPSANRSGRISPTSASHVEAELSDTPAMILDGGPCKHGLESTVVGVAGGEPVLLRLGSVPREAIEAVLGHAIADAEENAAISSPGQLERHYAPETKLRLGATDLREGEALLAFGPNAPQGASASINLSATGNVEEAASHLFAALRELDAKKASGIAVMPIPAHGLGEAINDRLQRAAKAR
jgi:L-threonylcarbamoyladenylate synthase